MVFGTFGTYFILFIGLSAVRRSGKGLNVRILSSATEQGRNEKLPEIGKLHQKVYT